MKRLVITLLIFLTIYVIYFDLQNGTLPSNEEPSIETQATTIGQNLSHFEEKVQSGDTVISIIEAYTGNTLTVSIDVLISDFQTLNNGLTPQEIQIGKTYFFPIYK